MLLFMVVKMAVCLSLCVLGFKHLGVFGGAKVNDTSYLEVGTDCVGNGISFMWLEVGCVVCVVLLLYMDMVSFDRH